MNKLINVYPLISLLFLAVFLGLLWRLEIEFHGWQGLIWVSYFHVSVPVGFGLFLLWANVLVNIDWKNRIFLNLATMVFGLLMYLGLVTSLTFIFAGGPFGFWLLIETSEWEQNFYRFLIFLLIPLIPIGAYLLLKAVRRNPPIKFLAFAVLGLICSIPISVLLLEVFDHKGGADIIHTIKSGALVPFWVFSLGVLVIGQKKEVINQAFDSSHGSNQLGQKSEWEFEFPSHWKSIDSTPFDFAKVNAEVFGLPMPNREYEKELMREVSQEHVLYNAKVEAIGYCLDDLNEVLFLTNCSGKEFAVVHLTWAKERSASFPNTVFYGSFTEFVEAEKKRE